MGFDFSKLPQVITAIGGLGTAAFGLVDASKVLGDLGPNRIGFGSIEAVIKSLTPDAPTNGLSQSKIVDTLKSNWFNGTDLSGQKAIAKTLVKQNLNPTNAGELAHKTGVDPTVLTSVATKIAAGTALSNEITDEINVNARFDLILTAVLDETYQHADNIYRNWTRAIAGVVAVGLAIAGGFVLDAANPHVLQCLIVGLLATPLAPIAKDLSTALATAVNTLQAVRK